MKILRYRSFLLHRAPPCSTVLHRATLVLATLEMIYPETEVEFPWFRRNTRILSVFFLLLVLVGAILAFVFTSSSRTFPCASYSPSSLANEVKLDCLQYLWTASGCKPVHGATFPPSGYSGWWNRSPAGAQTVSCPSGVDTNSCGAGSYSAIMTYMQLCRPGYTG